MTQVAWFAINSFILSSERQNEDLGDFAGSSDLSSNSRAEKFASFGMYNARYIQPSEIVNQYSLKLWDKAASTGAQNLPDIRAPNRIIIKPKYKKLNIQTIKLPTVTHWMDNVYTYGSTQVLKEIQYLTDTTKKGTPF